MNLLQYTCINYFPESNEYVVDYLNSFSNSYACLRIDQIEKQRQSALSHKFWKIYVPAIYNENNIYSLYNDMRELNSTHKITSPNILYAICIENKQYEIIWSTNDIKTLYTQNALFTLNVLNLFI